MSKITEEEIQKILPVKGPSFEEVKNYLKKYTDEYIVIKCGGSALADQNLFDNFINDISVGSSSKECATAMIISPTLRRLSLQTGPPIIISEISTC